MTQSYQGKWLPWIEWLTCSDSVGARWPGPSSIPTAHLSLRAFLLRLMELPLEHLRLFTSSEFIILYVSLIMLWLHRSGLCSSIRIPSRSCLSITWFVHMHFLAGYSLSAVVLSRFDPLDVCVWMHCPKGMTSCSCILVRMDVALLQKVCHCGSGIWGLLGLRFYPVQKDPPPSCLQYRLS